MSRIVVVGGGITGLAAAHHLHRQGADYLLVEARDRLGGKIVTETVDGFLLDGGPDAFLSERRQVFELTEQVGLSGRLLNTNDAHRGTFVFSGGRLHRLPEGLVMMVPTRILPFLASPLVSWPGKLRMALDLVLPPRRGEGDESLAHFVTRRLGREALDKIAEPLVAGIHAGDPETMSLAASFPRFLEMERRHGSLIRAMLAARRRPAAPPSATGAPGAAAGPGGAPPRRTYFMSYVGGMGELPAAVAARLDPARVVVGRAVTRIDAAAPAAPGGPEAGAAGGRAPYRVHVAGMAPVEAAAVVLAVPAPAAAALLASVAPEVAARLQAMTFASSATVNLAFRRADLPRPLEGFGFVVPAVEGRRIMGVTYTSVKWDHRVPDEESVLLRVFVGGRANQALAEADEAAILAAVREELGDILGIAAPPRLARVHPWRRAWPQYALGHRERVAALASALAAHPGLCLAGDSYHGVGIGHCIQSGVDAAARALAARRA